MLRKEIYDIINSNKYLSLKQVNFIIIEIEINVDIFLKHIDKNIFCQFLYNNLQRFNRFTAPTPFVLEENSKEIYNRLLTIFNKVQPHYDNLACLNLDKLLWDAFDKINERCCANELKPIIKNKIKLPTSLEKLKEFNEHKNKLNEYLSGYLNSSLITEIETIIPVSPVKSETTVKTVYKNLNIQIQFKPEFYNTPQSFLTSAKGQLNIPLANSQWQNSVCKIKIKIFGLLDPITSVDPLTISFGEKLPHDKWPSIFTDVFYIIENISWQIYDVKSKIGRWNISPSDLASITWSVYSNKQRIEFIKKDPPVLSKISTNESLPKEITIKNIDKEISWFTKCLTIAKGKLSQGETNEALFWLNIGVESLFEERSLLMLDSKGLNYESINSGRSYWISAAELISEQFPDISKQIKWPESAVGIPSWFSKIKFLDKEIGFTVNKKKIINNYLRINKHRNSLFHGSTAKRINSIQVNKAIEAYLWLIDNFK
tara:strand:+ start:1259 stop:2716 length:1458 start_codon:yes stop_codon:yes gene_type:complete